MTAPETIAPPPDLSTKPKDIVGYCFGFSCPNHHIDNTFESITVDKYGEQRVCQTCGEISTPAVVKRTAVAQWVDTNDYLSIAGYIPDKPDYGWIQRFYPSCDVIYTNHEFVKFLNDGIPVSA